MSLDIDRLYRDRKSAKHLPGPKENETGLKKVGEL